MDIPNDVKVRVCIEQGSVFNVFMQMNGSGRESKNRFFVVLNKNPKTDTAVILVTSTSQIAKRRTFVRRAGISEKTIVAVSPSEYRVFSKESVFDCNDVFEVKMEDLVRKVDEGGSMDYPKIPERVLARLVAGVNESPRVAPAIKKLI